MTDMAAWIQDRFPHALVMEFNYPSFDLLEVDFWWCPLRPHELRGLVTNLEWLPTRAIWAGFGRDTRYTHLELTRHRC